VIASVLDQGPAISVLGDGWAWRRRSNHARRINDLNTIADGNYRKSATCARENCSERVNRLKHR